MNARPGWTLVNNGNPGQTAARTMFRDESLIERGQESVPMPQQQVPRRGAICALDRFWPRPEAIAKAGGAA